MRLKPKKKSQVISVSDRPPEVISVSGDSVFFRVFFDIDAKAAIDLSVVTCNFRIFENSLNLNYKFNLSSKQSSLMLNNPSVRKQKSEEFQKKIVSLGTTDVTKQIPNDNINNIRKGLGAKKSKTVSLVDPKDTNSIRTRSTESSTDADVSPNSKNIFPHRLDSLYVKDVDPASEVNKVPFHANVKLQFQGLRTVGRLSSLNKKDQEFRKSISKNVKSKKNIKLEVKNYDKVQTHFDFSISKSLLRKYTVEIDAISKAKLLISSRVLQTISFPIDLNSSYKSYVIPTLAPVSEITTSGRANFINVKQKDKNAVGIKIFRRIVSKSKTEKAQFVEVANFRTKKGEQINFVDRPESSGKFIYRVVPYDEFNRTTGEFSSIVLPSIRGIDRKSHPDSSSILTSENGASIKIEIFNIPNDVVSIRLVRKNKTTKERIFSSPNSVRNGPIRSIDRSTDDVVFEDFPTRPDTIYEYKVIQTNIYGTSKESESISLIHYIGDRKAQQGRVINASSPVVRSGNSPSVNFQVNAPTDEASLDGIYRILETSGLNTQYLNEIKSNRELFNKVVAFEMLRFDTVTGQNESFGVINSGVFEDNEKSRKSANVSDLVPGRNYIYHYRLLLRSTSTIFNDILVDREDQETAKKFTTNMKKFNSPNVLKKGVLPSTSRIKQTVSKTGISADPINGTTNEMLEGMTSLVGRTNVSISVNETTLEGLTVKRSANGNILKWKVSSGSQKIDHVIVIAEYNGTQAPVRSIHFDGNNNMTFIDTRLNVPLDDVKYYVYPVFLDLRPGNLAGPARSE